MPSATERFAKGTESVAGMNQFADVRSHTPGRKVVGARVACRIRRQEVCAGFETGPGGLVIA